MIVKMYSVYDSKAEAFLPPFFMLSRGSAIRDFSDAVNDASHVFFKHREDYTLFELGSFDDSSAAFALSLTPTSLGVGIEFVK